MNSPHRIRQQDRRRSGCQRTGDQQPDSSSQEDAQSYPNLEEAPTFISRQRQQAAPHVFTTTGSPDNLQGMQLEIYYTMRDHFTSTITTPLHLIVTGTVSTGKSYLIQSLLLLLGDTLEVAAPTDVAPFIINPLTGMVAEMFHPRVRIFEVARYNDW